MPIAWTFMRGSKIRLSFAGCDADHFMRVPHGREPVFTLRCGGDGGSSLVLPVVDAP
jgi:hypothetical protein